MLNPCTQSAPIALMSVSAFDGRKNNLDFIRFALATLVLYSHCYYLNDTASEDPLLRATRQIWFGGLAVNGFFAISGFLIIASWMKSDSTWDYFRKRVGRIYPGFLVVCIASRWRDLWECRARPSIGATAIGAASRSPRLHWARRRCLLLSRKMPRMC